MDASASPDTSGILCCEVCGKYGLPQEFSASGRFCSLSCVGVYTGRRNKGREYVRHAKTVDGKIVKRKKKDKGKKPALSAKSGSPRDHVSTNRRARRCSINYAHANTRPIVLDTFQHRVFGSFWQLLDNVWKVSSLLLSCYHKCSPTMLHKFKQDRSAKMLNL